MKKLLFGLLISTLLSASNPIVEYYYVMQVQGKIKVLGENSFLKTRSKIKSTDKLVFVDKNAKAAVYSSGKGRFVLKAEKANKPSNPQSELYYFVKENLFAARKKASTRANVFMNNNLDFANYFSAPQRVVLDGETSVKVSATAFPTNENTFFFLRYSYKGEEINKKLRHKDSQIYFSKEDVFRIDGDMINPKDAEDLKLYYYDALKEEARLVCELSSKFVFLDNEQLQSELSFMVEDLRQQEKGYEDILDEALAYLDEFYGSTDRSELGDWLVKNLSVER